MTSQVSWHAWGDHQVMFWITLPVLLPNFSVWLSVPYFLSTLGWKAYLCQICSMKRAGNEMRFAAKMLLSFFHFEDDGWTEGRYSEMWHMYSVLKSSLLLGNNWPVYSVLWVGYPGLSGGTIWVSGQVYYGRYPRKRGDTLIMHGNPSNDIQVVRKSPLFRVV